MDDVPRISVVIPHLNEPEDLARCLLALHAQQHAPTFEIIVADNGSRTQPAAVCAPYPDVQLVLEPTHGPGPARNRGSSLARGEIIAFIDADCVAAPDWLANIANFFDADPSLDFIGGAIGILPQNPPALSAIEAYEAIFSYRARMFVERDNFAATGNMAVRRSVFEVIGPFDGIASHEDRRWGQEAVGRGCSLAYLASARVLTPACRNFSELALRIDRHVAHDLADMPPGLSGRLRWTLRTLAMPLSPLRDVAEIVRYAEPMPFATRCKAFGCLVRTRFYRGRRMLEMLLRDTSRERLRSWNRA